MATGSTTNSTMRALQLTDWESTPVLTEVAVPEPQGSEVLVEVTAAGLCRSDLHIMSSPAGVYPYELPFTLGHETAGRVAALGSAASGVAEGDPVVVYSRWGCGSCWQCANGRDNACARTQRGPHGAGLGRNGGLADYLLVPAARYLVPAPGTRSGACRAAHRRRADVVPRRQAVARATAAREHRARARGRRARASGGADPQGDHVGPRARGRRAPVRARSGSRGGSRRGSERDRA